MGGNFTSPICPQFIYYNAKTNRAIQEKTIATSPIGFGSVSITIQCHVSGMRCLVLLPEQRAGATHPSASMRHRLRSSFIFAGPGCDAWLGDSGG